MYHVDVSKDFVPLKAFKGDDVSFPSAELPLEIFLAIPMVAAGFPSNELWVFMNRPFASCSSFKGSLRARHGILWTLYASQAGNSHSASRVAKGFGVVSEYLLSGLIFWNLL